MDTKEYIFGFRGRSISKKEKSIQFPSESSIRPTSFQSTKRRLTIESQRDSCCLFCNTRDWDEAKHGQGTEDENPQALLWKLTKATFQTRRYLSFLCEKILKRDRFHSLHDTRWEAGLLLFAVWMENETFHYIATRFEDRKDNTLWRKRRRRE